MQIIVHQRAKSTADFINKLKIVEEEADESMDWLEMFIEILDDNQIELNRLHVKANELLAITVAAMNTTRKNRKKE